MIVVLTGGGTGGHIYPAIAVAQALQQDSAIKRLYYIGCLRNPEKDIAEKEGLKFYSINISGMPRRSPVKFLLWLLKLGIATLKSAFLLLKLRPNVVFGTGGYVTAPVLMAAFCLKIPYIIHDPDAYPGIVNRFMAPKAKSVSVAFEQAKAHLKSSNIKVYGNPVRTSLCSISREEAITSLGLSPDRKTVLVTGGSQGAKKINDAVRELAPILVKGSGFQVIHQTGKRNFEEYMESLAFQHPEYIVRPYFDDMAIPLRAADIAISRAGSLSISELNLCGLPSILVPYPYAAADHQRFNARAMERAGASLYLEDDECGPEALLELIKQVFSNINSMRQANLELARPHAVKDIVSEISST